ncbi:MAG: lipopolysaccharide biosynthesis protein [Burkholderiales bacterium]|nr:MAG: lipopolysaccharide biosynthesis protein [Burkholderiales bacterium]
MLAGLLRHSLNYGAASVLVTVAGLVTFPIVTRSLSVAEYGQLTLVGTLLTLWVGLSKLGVQHASLRSYAEMVAGRLGVDAITWRSTVLFGMLGSGLVAALLAAGLISALPESWLADLPHGLLLALVAGLVVVRTVESALVNPLRAQERSGVVSIFNVARRYLALLLTVGVLLGVSASVVGFFGATLAAEGLAIVALAAWMHRRMPFSPRAVSPDLLRSMVVFGLPLVGYEAANVLLVLGDRYLIQHLLGSEPLGLYGAVWNLCDYGRVAVLLSLTQTIVPAYTRTWEESGAAATEALLARFTGLYAMLAFPLVAGTAAIAPIGLPLLASERYAAGADIAGWVLAGMAIESWIVVASAGIMLRKRTRALMVAVAIAGVLNLGLVALLLPALGILGAAVGSVVSMGVLAVVVMRLGTSTLRVTLPWRALAVHAAGATLMYATIVRLDAGGAVATLILQIGVGAAVYGAFELVFDPRARELALAGIARARVSLR